MKRRALIFSCIFFLIKKANSIKIPSANDTLAFLVRICEC